MKNNIVCGFAVVSMVFLLLSPCLADTYVLTEDQQWKSVTDDPQAQFLLSVSKIKMAIASGNSSDAVEMLEELKSQYSTLVGPDLDMFIEAELFFAKAKWTKAVRKYKQFLQEYPDSIFYNAALERIYSVAAGFLAGQKQTLLGFLKVPAWDTGAELIRDVADRAGTDPLAYQALKTLANAQEKKKLFMEAYQTWAEIADRWPTGDLGMEALLSMAQMLHTAYQDPESDASVLRGAMSYYQDFSKRYPALAQQYDISQIIATIREQMAYKQYHVGSYYERTENIQGASLYYQQVLDEWPDTEAAKMAGARSAALKVGEALAVPNTTGRKLFRIGNAILDHWFGFDAFLDLPSPDKEETNDLDRDQ